MAKIRLFLKILMFLLIIGFASNAILQEVSYYFYKGDRQVSDPIITPKKIEYTDKLTGYGHNLSLDSKAIILFFGGSGDIAYNCVAKYSLYYDVPFLAVDYYGTQDSQGKMDLSTMQKSATDFFDYCKARYPSRKIVVTGHSYGCGMAAYLASARDCDSLILLAGYRDLSDLYNKIIPIFQGPFKAFISDDIRVDQYAKQTVCPVTIVASQADNTLGADFQEKVRRLYNGAKLLTFPDIDHGDYPTDKRVIALIKEQLQ